MKKRRLALVCRADKPPSTGRPFGNGAEGPESLRGLDLETRKSGLAAAPCNEAHGAQTGQHERVGLRFWNRVDRGAQVVDQEALRTSCEIADGRFQRKRRARSASSEQAVDVRLLRLINHEG